MNFDKKSLSRLVSLPDDELEAVITDIAREAGVEGQINVKNSDLSKLRAFLSVASEEDVLSLINRFGGRKK